MKTPSFLPRHRWAVTAVLSVVCTAGLAAVPVLAGARPAAAQNATEKRMVEATLPALVKTEEVEKLFGERKWTECLAAMDEAEKLYENAFKRFPDAAVQVTVHATPADLPAARKYGFVANDTIMWFLQGHAVGSVLDNIVVVPVAGGRVSAGQLHGMLVSMRRLVVTFAGKAFPYNGDGTTQPDEIDAKDFYEDAYRMADRIELPVLDNAWEAVVLLMNRATLMLEAGRSMNPKLETEERNNGKVGSEITKAVAEKLAAAEKEYKPAANRLASEVPQFVETYRNGTLAELDTMLARVNNGSYYDTGNAAMVSGWGRAQQLASLKKLFADAYAKEAKIMPADVMKPLETKITEVNAALDHKAPSLTFAAQNVAPAGIANAAKSAVLKDYPGAVVVGVGMDDSTFSINRDELGNIVNRTRDGRILFKMPGENWHCSLLFTYAEANAGGGSYVAPGHAHLGNIMRLESGK